MTFAPISNTFTQRAHNKEKIQIDNFLMILKKSTHQLNYKFKVHMFFSCIQSFPKCIQIYQSENNYLNVKIEKILNDRQIRQIKIIFHSILNNFSISNFLK